jgi:parvulin-like peptidyl-prolyl isomerase
MRLKVFTIALMLAGLTPAVGQLAASHSSTLTAAQPSTTTQPMGNPVVRVNGTVLTDRDLIREEYTIFPYARQHGGAIPKEMESSIRNGALQMIIFEELVYQEAQRRKMAIAAGKLQKAEADFRGQFNSPQEFQGFLKSECNGSEQVMRKKIERSLLIDQLLKSEVDSRSVVTGAELKAYYDKNSQLFQYGESFAIQTISFIPPEKATLQQVQEAKKRAEAALPQAKATKSYEEFGVLAEKISEDDYRVMMGDHKAMDRNQLAPQVVSALLQAGEITDILQVDQVYTIVRLNKHIPAGKVKFEDVKDRLKKELEKNKLNEVRAAFDKKLRSNAKIEVL